RGAVAETGEGFLFEFAGPRGGVGPVGGAADGGGGPQLQRLGRVVSGLPQVIEVDVGGVDRGVCGEAGGQREPEHGAGDADAVAAGHVVGVAVADLQVGGSGFHPVAGIGGLVRAVVDLGPGGCLCGVWLAAPGRVDVDGVDQAGT